MALGKGVAGKAFDLPPYLGDHVGGVALVGGFVEEGLAGLLELLARPEFARHPPPQHIGLPEVEPGEPVGHLDHVFLVDHDAIGLRHNLQQDGVGVTAPLGEPVPLDVGLHHPAARHARPDDGAGGDQAEVVVDPQLAHEHSHGGRFHVEASDGLGFPQQVLHPRVGLEPLHVVDVDVGRRVGLRDEVEGVLDFGEAALGQDVEFVEGEVLGDHHVVLRGGEPFGRQERCAGPVDGSVGDQDAAGVDGDLVGEIAEDAGVADDGAFHFAQPRRVEPPAGQRVDLVLGQAEHLAELPHHRPVLEGVVGAEQGHVLVAVEDVARDVVAVGPGEVEVEVGRVGPVEVDEPLEVEVQFNRVDVGDAQEVGDEAVGPAAPADVEVALGPRVGGDVPIDEEVGEEFLFAEDLDFVLHPFEDGLVGIGVAVGEALGAEVAEEVLVLDDGAGEGAEVAVGGAVFLIAEVAVEVDVAGVEQGGGAVGEPGKFGVGRFEFANAQPAVGVGGDLVGRQFGEEAIAVDGAEQSVGVVVALVAEAGRMEGHHAAARGALGVALEGQPEGAEFAGPDAHAFVGAQAAGLLPGGPRGAIGRPLRPPRPGVDPHHTLEGRGAVRHPGGLASMAGVQQVGEEAAEPLVAVVVAGEADIALDRTVAEVDAEHGTHAILRGQPGEIRSAGGAVHVGEGQARHARRLRLGEEFLRAQDAVAEAEPRMGVQEHGGGKRRRVRRGCLDRTPIRGPGVCAPGTRPCRTSPATGGVRSRTPGRRVRRWAAAGWCR